MYKPTAEVLINFFRGLSSTEEQEAIKIYLAMNIDREYVTECLRQAFPELHEQEGLQLPEQELDLVWRNFETQIADNGKGRQPRRLGRKSWYRYAAAVAVFALSTSLLLVYLANRNSNSGDLAQQTQDAELPGSDKAVLTLADGRTISLSDAENGNIVDQHGLHVDKTAEGEIVYRVDDNAKNGLKNSVATPRGGQYRITLPDGSKAMLNAASSLTYPIQFEEGERRVQMTGEVYFEVVPALDSRKKRIPFFVETAGQEIQVLGTQFNVNAYDDDAYIRTTLIEGSVRVKNTVNGQFILLKPGQQSILDKNINVQAADIQEQLAWKNGEFVFKGQALGTMLKQVGRWYDVDVECPSRLARLEFSGIVSRSTPLSTIVKMIESTREVKVSIKGRRLIVSE